MASTIIDNGGAGYADAGGGWGNNTYNAGYYGSNYRRVNPGGGGANTADWTFTGLTAGVTYYLGLTWPANGAHSTNVPVKVYDSDGTTLLGSTTVDQHVAPASFTDTAQPWGYIGSFTPTGTSLKIHIDDNADGYTVADAAVLTDTLPNITSISIANGNADNAATWDKGVLPGGGRACIVTHNVDLNYAMSLSSLTFGTSQFGKTLTLSAAVTVTGSGESVILTDSQADDATKFNNVSYSSGGKLIMRPASGQTNYISVRGKTRLNGDVWLEFSNADGGTASWMQISGASAYTAIMIDCTSLRLVKMGTASSYGAPFTFFGSSDAAMPNTYCDHSSLSLGVNAHFGYSGTLTIDKLAIETPTPITGFSEGLSINCSTAVISRMVLKNCYTLMTSYDTLDSVVQYDDSAASFPFIGSINTKLALIWDKAVANPHFNLPAGDQIFIEMPQADLGGGDPGDLYTVAGQTTTRLILPPIRTGPDAGKGFASIHLPAITGGTDFTLEHSVLPCNGLTSAIYNGESAEGSEANKILSVKSNIFYGNGGYVLRDLAGTPVVNNYPAARFNNNLLDTRLTTGTSLGVHSSVTTSSGTYNANGQTKNTPAFKRASYFATWAATQNGTTSDANGIALLLADPSLVDGLFTYLYDGWQSTDAEAHGTGVGGTDMGVGYSAPSGGGTAATLGIADLFGNVFGDGDIVIANGRRAG